jgi:Mn2+/Fe2+ NRAMP family transporter
VQARTPANAPCGVKRFLQLGLGIVTSVGGFLEIGSIATSAQAGAQFGYQLAWSIALGTICIAFLVEMSGRFAACSKRTIPDAMRERFGARAFAVPFVGMLVVSILVLAAEISGVAAALELASGIAVPVWTVPVAFASWALLWRATFGVIENGVSLLGLVTVVFAVAALDLHPDHQLFIRGLLPSLPSHDRTRYWFSAVSILGASITPSLYYFYSSGAIEEEWDETYLRVNRWIAGIGMSFGGLLAIAVLVLAAELFPAIGKHVESYRDLTLLVTSPFGRTGFWLFVAALGIACFGATLEFALSLAYFVAQGLGWKWGENLRPGENARFSLAYTLILVIASVPVLLGADPLKLTNLAMAATAATLPLGVFPFLILMNDRTYLGARTNGAIGNAVVLFISLLAMLLAVVTIPLELVGG